MAIWLKNQPRLSVAQKSVRQEWSVRGAVRPVDVPYWWRKKTGMGQVTVRDLWTKTQKELVQIQTGMGLNMTWQHHQRPVIFTRAQSMNQRICRPDLKIVISLRWQYLVSCVLVRVNCFGSVTADKVVGSARLYAGLWGQAGAPVLCSVIRSGRTHSCCCLRSVSDLSLPHSTGVRVETSRKKERKHVEPKFTSLGLNLDVCWRVNEFNWLV